MATGSNVLAHSPAIPRIVTALIAALLVGCAGLASGPDAATDTPARAADKDVRQSLWSFTTGGAIWSSPVHANGALYFGSDDGKLYALDVNTHRERWTYATGGKVRSTPAVDSSTVFFSSDDGFLYAVDAASGKLKWKFDLGDGAVQRILPANEPPYAFDYLKSSPVLRDGVLYAGSGNGRLYAVDAQTGALKWTFASGGMIRSTPLVHGAHVYVGSWDGKLYCIDRPSGRQVWNYPTKDAIQASPVYADGKIIFGGRDPRLFALDADTGAEVWTHPYTDGSWVESSAVAQGDTLYVGSSDSRKLSAFDIRSGKEVWAFPTEGWSWMTPLVNDGVVYIGAIAATPYPQTIKPGFFAVDARNGSLKWRYAPEGIKGYVTGGVFATPVAVNDMILVADLDGAIRAFRK